MPAHYRTASDQGHPPQGFTLIELMVVMFLMTIVLAVAIPRLGDGMMQDPQKHVTRWMVNTARALRAMAVEKQTIQALVLDLDNHRMWTIDAQMDEEAMAAAAEKAFRLPNSMKLSDVSFPDKDRAATGTVALHFYPNGYADQALVHVTYDDTIRFSYKIEPLLPKVKRIEEWADY
jgi:prepilin-type N-terminal cleavage/methylation domain-containing protein